MDTMARIYLSSVFRFILSGIVSIVSIVSRDQRVHFEGGTGLPARAHGITGRKGADITMLFQQSEQGINILDGLTDPPQSAVGLASGELLRVFLGEPAEQSACRGDPRISIHDGIDFPHVGLKIGY